MAQAERSLVLLPSSPRYSHNQLCYSSYAPTSPSFIWPCCLQNSTYSWGPSLSGFIYVFYIKPAIVVRVRIWQSRTTRTTTYDCSPVSRAWVVIICKQNVYMVTACRRTGRETINNQYPAGFQSLSSSPVTGHGV